MEEGFVTAHGLRFHTVSEGPPDGRLVLLLHGFPEFWYSWRHQLPALGACGLRAVAPDLRGYNLSDRPRGVRAYDLDLLAGDIAALVGALGADQADLVGHDWGGAVAWHTAAHHPQRVRRLAVLSCPPPAALAQALLRDPGQRRRSAYMFFFQLPYWPERRLGGARLRDWIRSWAGRGDVFSEEDLDRYVEAFAQPGALSAALNYYRAAFRRSFRTLRERPRPVEAPTLVLWGQTDRILGVDLLRGLDRFVAGPLRVEVVPGAGHFVQQEAPEAVSRLLCEFLC